LTGLRIAGHPVHPALVHFPIALWTAAVACDSASAAGLHVDPALGYWALVAGLALSALALLAGFVDYALLDVTPAVQRTANAHMIAMCVASSLFFVAAWLRGGPVPPGAASLACSIAGWLVLIAGGWLGGTLVYRHGVAVAAAEGSLRSRNPASGH
jgi:uncharacterized membrane protein